MAEPNPDKPGLPTGPATAPWVNLLSSTIIRLENQAANRPPDGGNSSWGSSVVSVVKTGLSIRLTRWARRAAPSPRWTLWRNCDTVST